MRLVRRASFVVILGVLAACSRGGAIEEPVGVSRGALSFSSGNNDGYCASNPSASCFQGTPVGAKQIVLTFDDGPGSRTSELSSYLKNHGIRATFFVNGKNFGADAGTLLSQLVADGHLVANHTQDHLDLTSLGDSAIVSELVQTDDIIAPYVPNGRFVFRAPFGDWSAHDYSVLSATAMNKYAGPVRWDIGGQTTGSYAADWDCWQNQGWTSKTCGDRYLNEIRDVGRGIVLMHDQDYGNASNHDLTNGVGNSIDMAKYVIETLQAQGYSFLRVDEVPDIAAALPAGGGGGGGGGACYTPTIQQTNDANEWWAEYTIGDPSVTSATLEVVGARTVALTSMWGSWVGSTGGAVPAGTPVIVHATNAAGQTAQTSPFGYLVTTRPTATCGGGGACVPSCAGKACGADDGCGGSCPACGGGACFAPTFQQTSDANEWWIEYGISDPTVTSATLEVVGVRTVSLSSMWGVWVGPTPQIPAGTPVIVHAKNAAGASASTSTFGYLSVRTPPTQACN